MLGGSGTVAQGADGPRCRSVGPAIAVRLGWRGLLTWVALAAGLVAGRYDVAAVPAIANGDFEGTFPGSGTTSFAGGTAADWTGTAANRPANWLSAINTSVGGAKWVNSPVTSAAHGGTKYAYGYSSGTVIGGDDACLYQQSITGLVPGNCYTVCVYAAEAGGPVNNPGGLPGVVTFEMDFAGQPFEFGRAFVPYNPAWRDNVQTVIPWVQYCYTFTAPPGITTAKMWLSVNGYNGQTSYLVFDDLTITDTTCSSRYDYGDLPISGTTFNTTGGGTAANAPRHLVGVGGSLKLGPTIDDESNGQPSATATGDDLAYGPDEEGVTFPTLTAGSAANITIKVSGPNTGKLNAWIDWNNNGTFEAGNEVIATNVVMTVGGTDGAPGSNTLSVTPPAGAAKGVPLAARFRLSLAGNDASTGGTAVSGEIEDYVVYVTGALDFGDLPDTGTGTGTGNYKTLDSDGGPKHTLLNSLVLGATVDAEANGVSSTLATGDDSAGVDDEDGVAIGSVTFVQGQTAIVPVTVSKVLGGTAKLNAFFDFNNNGSFADSGETMTELTVLVPPSGSVTVNLSVPVPSGATTGANLGARFRISTAGGLTATSGLAADGEVEDYVFQVLAAQDLGDLPDTGTGTGAGNYRTLASDNGARHTIVVGLHLGTTAPDADTGLLQNTAATSDDATNSGATDDEDGIASFPTFTAGRSATVTVSVNNPSGGIGAATLYGFIDWNNDGDFGDTGKAVSAAVPDATVGNVSLVFNVPAAAVTGVNLGARFRITTDTLTLDDAGSQGLASNGEVEDYLVSVAVGYDYGDLSVTSTTFNTAGAGTAANAPRHQVGALRLGTNVDSEANGVPGTNADGDDTALTPDDEDGVIFPASIAQGQTLLLPIIVTGGSGLLNAWVDWNNNGTFAAGAEVIATNVSLVAGTNYLTVSVPAAATIGSLAARFRLSTAGFNGCTNGTAVTGEIEDYKISVVAPARIGNKVWLDNGAGGGTSNNGVMDAGTESGTGGINGVGVAVYAADGAGNPAGFPLSAMNTAANGTTNGFYGFNLPPGTYVVVIPATNFVTGAPLVGLYSSGTGPTVCCNGTAGTTDKDDNGYNAINPVGTGVRSASVTIATTGMPTGEVDKGAGEGAVADAAADLTIDFGFVAAAPTAVKLGYVKGWWTGGQATVEWETVSELGALGFDLYRLEGGKRTRVNADLVAALNVERGGVYRVAEAMTKPTGPLSYLLVELEITGKQIEYGPFTVLVQSGASVSSVDAKGGALEFRFSGEPGATYEIECTEDMVHGRWTRVGTVTADADGVLLVHQPVGGSDPVRFYRALKP